MTQVGLPFHAATFVFKQVCLFVLAHCCSFKLFRLSPREFVFCSERESTPSSRLFFSCCSSRLSPKTRNLSRPSSFGSRSGFTRDFRSAPVTPTLGWTARLARAILSVSSSTTAIPDVMAIGKWRFLCCAVSPRGDSHARRARSREWCVGCEFVVVFESGRNDGFNVLFVGDRCSRLSKVALLFADSVYFPTSATRAMHSFCQREGKGTASGAVLMTPTRLMAARKAMGNRVAQTAAEDFQGKTMWGSSTAQVLLNPDLLRLAPRDSDHPLFSDSSPLSSPAGAGYGSRTPHAQRMRRCTCRHCGATILPARKCDVFNTVVMLSLPGWKKQILAPSNRFSSTSRGAALTWGEALTSNFVERKTGHAAPAGPEGALDMTPPFMYYSVAWVWLEYLTRGLDAAEDAMSKCLDLIHPQKDPTIAGEGADLLPDDRGSFGGRTSAGERILL